MVGGDACQGFFPHCAGEQLCRYACGRAKQLKAEIETRNMKEITEKDIVMDYNPKSKNNFLTWKAGIYKMRPIFTPIYKGDKVVDTIETNGLCSMFHILGFGATEEEARDRALQFVTK
jgi:hypothetical protein